MVFQVNKAFLAQLAAGKSNDGTTAANQAAVQHLHCRSQGKAVLFDMSFLIQIRFQGTDCVEFLERILVGDIAGLEPGKGILSILTNEQGGIIDDAIITNVGDGFVMTIHSTYENHFAKEMDTFKGNVSMEYFQDSILALQGPGSHSILSKFVPFDLKDLSFMSSRDTTLTTGETCRIARCGFTGEDGFELHIPSANETFSIASRLLMDQNVMPAGLDALNTLRLEACLLAKGKEFHENVTPIEVGLGWTIPSRRRQEGGFLGADKLLLANDGKLHKPSRKCVGLVCSGLVEENTEIFNTMGDTKIGKVTSAAFSPCLKVPIAMALVEASFAKPGMELLLKSAQDDEMITAQVVKMPFIETRFYNLAASGTKTPPVKDNEPRLATTPVRDPSTGEEFDSPQTVAISFPNLKGLSKVPLENRKETGALTKVHDPSTGEVFDCPPLSI